MTNQEIAADRFTAYHNEMTAFHMGDWAKMTDMKARDAIESEIEDRHEYRHGWISVNGESFCLETAFPGERFHNVFD